MTTAISVPHYSYGRECETAKQLNIRIRCGIIDPGHCKWCTDLIIASANPPRPKDPPKPHDCFGYFSSICKHCWSCKDMAACIDDSNLVSVRIPILTGATP